MDNNTQKDSGHSSEPYSGYSSYNSNEPHNSGVVRSLEREMCLQEFKDDRDVIIQTLKTAIKNGEFDEAQEIVFQYRAAIKTDEQFAVLAQMVSENLESYKEIQKIETRLDATPDDEFQKRLDLCNQILKIKPQNAKYLEEKKRCEEALGIRPKQTLVEQKDNPPKKEKFFACPICFGIMAFLDIIMIIGSSAEDNPVRWAIGFAVALLLHFIMLSNQKFNPLKKASDGWKIGLSILLFFIIGMALV